MMELLVALTVILLSVLACTWLRSNSRADALDDLKLEPTGRSGDEHVTRTKSTTTAAEWSTLDDLQLTRLLRDATLR